MCERSDTTSKERERIDDGAQLAKQATEQLADARATFVGAHVDGLRERYREQLARAIDSASRALAALPLEQAGGVPDRERQRAWATAHKTLAQAHAARADDALHGAGQLSLSAQRAPTRQACEEGWQRVGAIVAGAEASAACAEQSASTLERHAPTSTSARAARKAAGRADAAARAARRILDQRNDAYTFHSDSRFSFGEGWYLAAAAVLDGVHIQVEPDKDLTLQNERFLADAGLDALCRPYRSRPRAMKHLTWIIADHFRANPQAAQQKLRDAFLGRGPISEAVRRWIDERLPPAGGVKRVLLWIRSGVHHPTRNTRYAELVELTRRVQELGFEPIVTGDALQEGSIPKGALDTILFWKERVFHGVDMRRAQLQFFEYLKSAHGLVGQLGVTTAGMDGPALLGLPTLYLTDVTNVRMRAWVGTVPGYLEVVRQPAYLEGISRILSTWLEPVD